VRVGITHEIFLYPDIIVEAGHTIYQNCMKNSSCGEFCQNMLVSIIFYAQDWVIHKKLTLVPVAIFKIVNFLEL
jgi:hypothetical protein